MDTFRLLWNELLDSDNGISEKAYMALLMLGQIVDPDFVNDAKRNVDATDGMFYIRGD